MFCFDSAKNKIWQLPWGLYEKLAQTFFPTHSYSSHIHATTITTTPTMPCSFPRSASLRSSFALIHCDMILFNILGVTVNAAAAMMWINAAVGIGIGRCCCCDQLFRFKQGSHEIMQLLFSCGLPFSLSMDMRSR